MLFSPLARALETAELLMPLVDGPAHPEPALAAAPQRGLARAPRALQPAGARPVLVGHQPHLARAGGLAGAGDGAPSAPPSTCKKGGALVLEGEPRPRGMQLVALLPPRLLRRWARA